MGRLIEICVNEELKSDSKLVHIVRQYPYLFDETHEQFDDAITRIATWEYIAELLGRSECDCEERWIYILNRFYDEICWMIKYGENSPWLLYPQLDFLNDFVRFEDLSLYYEELLNIETEELLNIETELATME